MPFLKDKDCQTAFQKFSFKELSETRERDKFERKSMETVYQSLLILDGQWQVFSR